MKIYRSFQKLISSTVFNIDNSGATDHHWSVIRSDQYLRFGTHVIRGLIYEKKKSRSHVQSTHSVVMLSGGTEELERPASFKSPVWEHFGFPVKYNDEGKRLVDKTVTVCRHCGTRKPYDSGNKSSMATHLKRHHAGVSLTGVKTKAAQQPLITAAFKQPLGAQSDRAKAITNAIGVFIGADMRPYSVVQNEGFKHMLKVLEPRYDIPSRTHFSEKIVPDLYEQEKKKVVDELSRASSVVLTTDGWTSRGTESYVTITAHFITADWEMRSPVLQTRPLYESHTGTHLAQVLTQAVEEWKINRPSTNIPVTTDNAKNQINAVNEAGLGPQIGCFAHAVNLASQKGISVNRMDRLLGRIRKVVSYFHRSTTAAHVLKTRQEIIKLPTHKLIHDVPTRWNSTYDMLERYLEQQAAILCIDRQDPEEKCKRHHHPVWWWCESGRGGPPGA